jgi:hypothetical protein
MSSSQTGNGERTMVGNSTMLRKQLLTYGFEEPVSAVAVHPSGTVVATCSGQRHMDGDMATKDSDAHAANGNQSEDEGGEALSNVTAPSYDNTLKIWSL